MAAFEGEPWGNPGVTLYLWRRLKGNPGGTVPMAAFEGEPWGNLVSMAAFEAEWRTYVPVWPSPRWPFPHDY